MGTIAGEGASKFRFVETKHTKEKYGKNLRERMTDTYDTAGSPLTAGRSILRIQRI